MTAYELVRLARRRWAVLTLGVFATFVLLVTAARPETVYWASLELRVAMPANPVAPKNLEDPEDEPTIATAMLLTLVNRGHVQPKSASADTTLYGEGQRQAVSARLRDTGGQWATSIREAVIDVQAVDLSASAVEANLQREHAELAQLLNQLQDDLGVAQAQRLAVVAPSPNVEVLQITGSRVRAMLSSTLLGLTLTLIVTYWVEVLSRGKDRGKRVGAASRRWHGRGARRPGGLVRLGSSRR